MYRYIFNKKRVVNYKCDEKLTKIVCHTVCYFIYRFSYKEASNISIFVVVSERLNVLYERNWTRLVHEQLRKFESSIVAAARQSPDAQPPELALDSKWTFSGAIIYCITLITTIG